LKFAPVKNTRQHQPPINRSPRKVEPRYVRHGLASWMGDAWLGHTTKSGETFDPERLTAAQATLPVPSYLYVTNNANGRTILVRINDRVPAKRDRVVAISQSAANLLGFRSLDRVAVDLQYAGPAGAAGDDQYEEVFLTRQPWYRPGMRVARRAGRRTPRSDLSGSRGQGSLRSRARVYR